ncbi:MAG TPA: molybdopterin-dependent oxidoreductase [Vicinamibacterales bacterium]|jgi:NADH-quinone oxidoreductase subunit G|nr:molybdopterin-dependent oxidoreductase [Vicinamibacterales bacterium]
METVTLTIDGRQVTVEKGKTVLQAAIEHNIKVPYYCYHPGLGIDGSCRVCIVKIEKMPKLQTSCSTLVAEGMVVMTQTPDVVEARASVFEFLLINHPLDCPVCDKGGECPLQDFSYSYGPNESRMGFARRVFDGEGVRADVDFGPTLMLNRNRCILCTRCVRFMREIDTDAQISIVDRGYGSEIATFQESGVHSLLSGNLMDVCPVGAITTRDYRFKSRPWDNPEAVDTICTLCEKGCNTTAWIKAKPEWAKGAVLVRMTPRFNPDVNGYWMCDIGRFDYHWIEGDQRLQRPLVRSSAGTLQPTDWRDAMAKIADRVDASGGPAALRFLLSAHASLEELFVFGRLGGSFKLPEEGVALSWRTREKPQPPDAKFKIPAIDAPNVTGARDLGFPASAAPSGAPDLGVFRNEIEAGRVAVLYVFDPGPAGSIGDTAWIIDAKKSGRLNTLIVHGVLMSDLAAAADVVLPGASWLEEDASYVNGEGRLQAAARAIPPPGEAQEDWQIFVNLGLALGASVTYASSTEVRAALAQAMSGNPTYAGLATMGFARPVSARHWLQASNPSERWKWDFMFQDLPPVKFEITPRAAAQSLKIPLQKVD